MPPAETELVSLWAMPPADVTGLLERWQRGDDAALEDLIPLLYDELRTLARHQFRSGVSGHTLQPTAVVNEAYLKLLGRNPGKVENRRHFFAVAATAMRQVLVDHARRRSAEKRAGDRRRITLTDRLGAPVEVAGPCVDTLELNDALCRLADIHPRAAQVVELRYFGGLTLDETAEVLGVTQKTIVRDWKTARLWLSARLDPPAGRPR